MRLGLAAFVKGRCPQSEKKVPCRILTPVALKDRVSGKGVKLTEKGCVQELSVFLACLREKDFDNFNCSKELLLFKQCSDRYEKMAKELKASRDKVIPEPNAKVLTHKQVTHFLKMYPIK